MNIIVRRALSFSSVAVLLLSSGVSLASGFQLWEENAGTLGNNHAGAAAEANSAADEFYNPAGIVTAKHPALSVGGAYIIANVQFDKGAKITDNKGTPLITDQFTLEHDEKGGTANAVPNIHFVTPINQQWFFSFGLTTPFGLSTDFTRDQYTPYAATKTQILSFNINPSIAYAVNKKLSLGLGFDAMYGSAIYNALNGVSFLGGPTVTSNLTNDLSGWGYGFNVGALYQLSEKTRFGLSYRSQVTIDAKGDSNFTLESDSTKDAKTTATANLPLPATTMLSVFHQLNQRVDVMASVFYSQWSVMKTITIKNTAALDMSTGANGMDLVDDKNFRDTWNVSLGANYHVNSEWMLMFGAGYDQTPTKDGYRDIRMPDSDHTTLSVGAQFSPLKHMAFSVGYAHIFMPRASIDNSQSSISSLDQAIGYAHSNANLLTAQLNWTFL